MITLPSFPKPRIPWACPLCGLHIFISKDKCPMCNGTIDSLIPKTTRTQLEEQGLLYLSQIGPTSSSHPLSPSLANSLPSDHIVLHKSELRLALFNIGSAKQKQNASLPVKKADTLRFVCLSDTHCTHRRIQIPDGDVLIHAGDISNCGDLASIQDFNQYVATLPHRYKIVIPGNHDTLFHPAFYDIHYWRYHESKISDEERHEATSNYILLQDEMVVVEGIRIYGSSWVPPYHDWAFNLEPEEIQKKWANIPDDTHLLITHTPPKGRRAKSKKGLDIGCEHLMARVKQVRPFVHVFGHVHASYGVDKGFPGVTFINASIVDNHYNANNAPIVFDISIVKETSKPQSTVITNDSEVIL